LQAYLVSKVKGKWCVDPCMCLDDAHEREQKRRQPHLRTHSTRSVRAGADAVHTQCRCRGSSEGGGEGGSEGSSKGGRDDAGAVTEEAASEFTGGLTAAESRRRGELQASLAALQKALVAAERQKNSPATLGSGSVIHTPSAERAPTTIA
jgi:hypothetical protein